MRISALVTLKNTNFFLIENVLKVYFNIKKSFHERAKN